MTSDRVAELTNHIAAVAKTCRDSWGVDRSMGDLVAEKFFRVIDYTAEYRLTLPTDHALLHVSLIGAAVQSCDEVECDPEGTAARALEAVIPHLPAGEVSGQIAHCEQPVNVKSRRTSWSGDYETEVISMLCGICAAELTLTVRADVGPPVGVA